MNYDALSCRYPSRRSLIYGRRGMVCTSQPLAAQAGLDMLKQGGNAVDAAIATAACMTVLEPTSNGLGSDAFALVWTQGKLHGLNASGRAPRSLTADAVRSRGHQAMPKRGWLPVMVPGAPSAWAELSQRFGRLPLRQVLQPAIDYAREGYPVSPVISQLWDRAYQEFSALPPAEEFQPWFDTFAPKGRAPRAGEVWSCPHMADTLEEIADTGAKAYYQGRLADAIDQFSQRTGGFLRKSDLEDYWCAWTDPIHIDYRGYDVWELPPNGDGIVALMALNILKGFDFTQRDTADPIHRQLEAMKLAFADGTHYVADPAAMEVSTQELLSEAYAARRRALIGPQALEPQHGDPHCGGTVYLCAADGEGNMVSYIQSNYVGFGSGIVIPDTGISLQNRGFSFSLNPEDCNCLEPGKKAFHTIIPGFLTKDGQPVGPFGVMGAFMQPQGHVQVITNTLDFHMNPQEALDAPRWQWVGGKNVEVEQGFPRGLTEELVRMGHQVTVASESLSFGRGQIIWRDEHGVLTGATEPRADGAVAAW